MAENVIELNGKRYDALTGAYLGVSHAKIEPSKIYSKNRGQVIDGFIRPTTTNEHAVAAKMAPAHVAAAPYKPGHKPRLSGDVIPIKRAKPVVKSEPKPKQEITPAAPRHRAAHKAGVAAKAHHPQRAQTLMRHVVHKPATAMKPAIKTQVPAEVPAKPLSAITVKRSALQVDQARMERAKAVTKHQGIRRFMPVRPDHSPTAVAMTPHRTPTHVPVIAVQPAPAVHHPKHYAAPTQRSHSDIFEAAIAHADSHKQPAHKHHPKHRRLINTLAGVAAFLVIGGFITYLNMPNIQLHVASVQAGFKADIPDYKLDGYALQGGIRRDGNTISMRFQSGEHTYVITQQASDWNSQTLAENTSALTAGNHKTVQASGRTIYIYNGSNAVWVNGNVRYDLTTNATLSTDDVTRLASSL